MHHVVFSKPHNAAQQQKLANNPRYILQQQIRAAMAAPPSLPAPLAATERPDPPEVFPAYNGGPLPRGITKALIPPTGKEAVPNGKGKKRFHKDWSVGIGSNGTTGVGQFPATFTQTALALRHRHRHLQHGPRRLRLAGHRSRIQQYLCLPAATAPTVYYAYNTGTAPVTTSVDLSGDGSQIAFITGASGSAASLVVVRTSNPADRSPATPATESPPALITAAPRLA